MKARIQRWGNSLAIRIPKAFAEEIGVAEDATVDISVRGGSLVVEPVRQPDEKLDLAQLVREIPEDYVTEVIDWGPPVGREIW
jgi:antitoxin MazE